jgi:hypothetical protein
MNLKTFWRENVYWPIRERFVVSDMDAFELGLWAATWRSRLHIPGLLVVSVSHEFEQGTHNPPKLYVFMGWDIEGMWAEFIEGVYK